MLRNLVKKFTIHNLNDGDGDQQQTNQSTNAGGGGGGGSANNGGAGAAGHGGAQAGNNQRVASTGGCGVNYLRSGGAGNLHHGGTGGNVGGQQNKGGGGCSAAGQQQQKRGKRTQTVKEGMSGVPEEDPKDSGTESDEELALTETNSIRSVPISLTSDYYASQQSLSASCRSSHCGSPLPDQDCNSWDSVGYESSGLSSNRNDQSNDLASFGEQVVELPNHHYHTRQQFRRFVKHQQISTQQISINNNNNIATRNLHINNNNNNNGGNGDLIGGGVGGGAYCNQSAIGKGGVKGQETPVALDYTGPTDQSATADIVTLEEHELVASPDSCSSSVDELESIYGLDGLAAADGVGLAKDISNNKQDASSFLIPNSINSLGDNTGRGRSSFTLCTSVSGSSTVVVVGAAEKRKWSQVQSGDFYNVSGVGVAAATVAAATPSAAASTISHHHSSLANSTTKIQVVGETGNNAITSATAISVGCNNNANHGITGSITRSHHCPPSVGARRTPVRLVIPLSPGQTGGGPTIALTTNQGTPPSSQSKHAAQWLTPPNTLDDSAAKSSPRKKCRSQLDEADESASSGQSQGSTAAAAGGQLTNGGERQRPSLNFDKMREKMKNKTGRRKHGSNVNTTAMKSKLRGWSPGYHLRSSRNECLFQPLKFPPSPPNNNNNSSQAE